MNIAKSKLHLGDKIGACEAIKKYKEFFIGEPMIGDVKEIEDKFCVK